MWLGKEASSSSIKAIEPDHTGSDSPIDSRIYALVVTTLAKVLMSWGSRCNKWVC